MTRLSTFYKVVTISKVIDMTKRRAKIISKIKGNSYQLYCNIMIKGENTTSTISSNIMGGSLHVKLNNTCRQSLLPLHYMP